MDFGFQVEALELHSPRPFSKLRPRGVQEMPKRPPRASKNAPRAPQEWPRAPQVRPRATKTCPGGAQGASRGYFFKDFFVFTCFFTFFNVFLPFMHFSAFFCFFCIFLRFLRLFCDFVGQNVFLDDSEQKFALPGETSGFHNRCFTLTSSC